MTIIQTQNQIQSSQSNGCNSSKKPYSNYNSAMGRTYNEKVDIVIGDFSSCADEKIEVKLINMWVDYFINDL